MAKINTIGLDGSSYLKLISTTSVINIENDNLLFGTFIGGTESKQSLFDNVIIGNYTASKISTAIRTIIIGNKSGVNITSAKRNIIVGAYSGNTLTKDDNIIIGANSVSGNGTKNVIIGSDSCCSNSDINNSIVIGYSNQVFGTNNFVAGLCNNVIGSNNIIFGNGKTINGNDNLVIQGIVTGNTTQLSVQPVVLFSKRTVFLNCNIETQGITFTTSSNVFTGSYTELQNVPAFFPPSGIRSGDFRVSEGNLEVITSNQSSNYISIKNFTSNLLPKCSLRMHTDLSLVPSIQLDAISESNWTSSFSVFVKPPGNNGSNALVEQLKINSSVTQINNEFQAKRLIISQDDTGPMVERMISSNQSNRYGIGQYAPGVTRVYSSGCNISSTISICRSTGLSNFDDLAVFGSCNITLSRAIDAPALFIASDSNFTSNVTLITNTSNCLGKVLQLKPCNFVYKNVYPAKTFTGLLTQDVQTVFPEGVSSNAQGVFSVDIQTVLTNLIGAVQQLHTLIGV